MPLLGRKEGVLLRKLPGFHKMFPYLMTTRTESSISYQQVVRVRKTLALLERLNAGRAERRITLFHVVLAAVVRVMALRPENNRFVVGRRIYQRKQIQLAFVTKKQLTEQAAETTVKIAFDPQDTLEKVAGRVHDVVAVTKKSETSSDENIADTLTRLPRFLTRFVVWIWGFLDYFNLLPYSVYRDDSFYASAFLANLGGINLDAVVHHLYEFGTCPFFVVVGRLKKAPVVDDGGQLAVEDVVTASFTLDERVTDGVHLSRTINLFLDLMEDPAPLLEPPGPLPDPYAKA